MLREAYRRLGKDSKNLRLEFFLPLHSLKLAPEEIPIPSGYLNKIHSENNFQL